MIHRLVKIHSGPDKDNLYLANFMRKLDPWANAGWEYATLEPATVRPLVPGELKPGEFYFGLVTGEMDNGRYVVEVSR